MEDIARENGTGVESPQSFNTESEYSIISRTPDANSYLSSQLLSQVPGFIGSSVDTSATSENEHLYMSHHALATAYEHLKIKFKNLELTNRSLQKRVSASSKRGENGLLSASVMNSHENNITKAWEAYTDKTKECQKLRDELRATEMKLAKSEDAARDQSLRGDVIRAQSMHDDLKKRLQQSELTINDLKHKEEMAREELEKEKEYQEKVLRSAEEHHHKMQSEIADLQSQVQEKNRRVQELINNQEKQKKFAQDLLDQQEATFKKQLSVLEGKVIREQEERARIAEELKLHQQEMRSFHNSTGLPMSISQLHQRKIDELERESENSSACSDIDAAELVSELQSLTEEINTLKKQASMQSLMLTRITEDPRIMESITTSLQSFDYEAISTNHIPSSQIVPVQCTENEPMGTGSADPSIDPRQIMDALGESSYVSRSSSGDITLSRSSNLAVSRHIHAIQGPSRGERGGETSAHRIDIPHDPAALNNAFNNLRLAKVNDNDLLQHVNTTDEVDPATSYYTTSPELDSNSLPSVVPASSHRRAPSNSDSNSDVTILGAAVAKNPHLISPEDGVVVRYPPSGGETPQPGMAAIWPSAGKRPSGTKMAAWPPGNSPGPSSRVTPSFELISGQPTSSNYDVTEESRDAEGMEFEVQSVRWPTKLPPRDVTLPPAHPSNRPTTRARMGERSSLSDSNSPAAAAAQQQQQQQRDRDRHLRRSMGSIEVIGEPRVPTDDRAFMSNEHLDIRDCPVCGELFGSDATQNSMQRHINGHFSEDEDDGIVVPTFYEP